MAVATTTPIEFFAETMTKTLKALRKPAIAVVLLGFLLTTCVPRSAMAAGGGRMGGSNFSSHSKESSSSSRLKESSSSHYYYERTVYVEPLGIGWSVFFLVIVVLTLIMLIPSKETTVLKLQVGLLGTGRALQRDLDRIAGTADTSTPAGLSYVLTETTLSLLRNPDCCISSYSSVDVKRSKDDGEKQFNYLSIEERGKLDEETLVNVNNIKRQMITSSEGATGFSNEYVVVSSAQDSGSSNEYIVVTVLVAAKGEHKLPEINVRKDLKDVLQELGCIPSNKILAVEVLWTPQNENETLSEQKLHEDYPILRPF